MIIKKRGKIFPRFFIIKKSKSELKPELRFDIDWRDFSNKAQKPKVRIGCR
jgi:hypothetical protein